MDEIKGDLKLNYTNNEIHIVDCGVPSYVEHYIM